MDEPSREQIGAIWRQLARRNDWQLVTDETLFFEQVEAELQRLSGSTQGEGRIRVAIYCAYSVLLHRGIVAGDNRAAQELWSAFKRVALRDDRSDDDANDLAQESVLRVIEKLPSLREPQSLISWSMMIFRTARRDLDGRTKRYLPLQAEDQDREQELADPIDLVAEVEQWVLQQEVIELLHAKLPKELDRQVLLRSIVMGDLPREIAHDLGIAPPRLRVIKNRALQRLKGDPQFMQAIAALVEPGTSGLIAGIGACDDES